LELGVLSEWSAHGLTTILFTPPGVRLQVPPRYRFLLPDGVPVSLKQESTQLAMKMFPCLNIVGVSEDVPVRPSGE
jgi:hypothetical protein